mmetsp:Transcript_7828/g.14493  ORF Transcript_7828/g.14493 Transcript_7828/m.14493 type:complete len:215 (+) Transcript_7828:197-841(+)
MGWDGDTEGARLPEREREKERDRERGRFATLARSLNSRSTASLAHKHAHPRSPSLTPLQSPTVSRSDELVLDLLVHVAEEVDVGHVAHGVALGAEVAGVPLVLARGVFDELVEELGLVQARACVGVLRDYADGFERRAILPELHDECPHSRVEGRRFRSLIVHQLHVLRPVLVVLHHTKQLVQHRLRSLVPNPDEQLTTVVKEVDAIWFDGIAG